MANSFIFYESFYEAINELDDRDQLEVYRALCEYALTGTMPELSGVASAMFKLMKPQIDANNKRRENGKKGAEYGKLGGRPPKEKPQENHKETPKKPQENGKATPNVNVNDNVNVKEKENKKKSTQRFSPPTVAQVKKFCDDHGYHLDAQRFVDYYTSNGWMVGRNKMKDWQAAARNWAKKNDTVVSGTKFSNYQSERRTDYDDIERRLIAQSMGG